MLEIAWDDGHRSIYDGPGLRWACPCAACQGEAGQPGALTFTRVLPVDELRLVDLSLIGQYALGLQFQSGHATGIYTFRYLRSLCPCGACPGGERR